MYDANREKGMDILENQIDIQEQTNEGNKGEKFGASCGSYLYDRFYGSGPSGPDLKNDCCCS